MSSFGSLVSHAVPLLADDVDTDQIIPARFLKVTDKQGLGAHLFADWRYLADGSPKADFVLNEAASQGAQVLLAGRNFGCGSSREHAPWALRGWGLRAVIALSFADIFRNNAIKNQLLPVVIESEVHARLSELVQADRQAQVQIDLATQRLRLPDGSESSFPLEAFAKHCLLNGVDELGYLLSFADRIAQHEATH